MQRAITTSGLNAVRAAHVQVACESQRLVADEQGLSCDFDYLWGERVELIDCLDTFDLGE